MREPEHSSDSPELALRVEERTSGMFFWVILAADHGHQVESPEAMCYRRLRAAHEPQEVYWNALVLGMAELRRILNSSAEKTSASHGTGAAAANSRESLGI